MNLRNTRAVTVTDPPSVTEAQLVAEYEILSSGQEAGTIDAQAAERMTAIEREIAPAEQMRITLAALNTVQYGRYEANRRRIVTYIETATGEKWAKAIDNPAHGPLIDAIIMWARVSAALVCIQSRQIRRVGSEDATPWIDVEADWPANPDAWIEAIPHDLADALDRVVFALNPGLFLPAGGTDAKKNGGISVG